MQYEDFMILWAIIAWFMIKWFFKLNIDDQLIFVAQDKMTVVMLLTSYVMLFYLFMLIAAMSFVAVVALMKMLIIDFFEVKFPTEALYSLLSFVSSERHVKFNLAFIAVFTVLTGVLMFISNTNDQNKLRKTMGNILTLLLIVYVTAFAAFYF